MGLDLEDDWVWDHWSAHDGARHHLFFLHAPRSLGDPDLRHVNAAVGHAVSDDLVAWTRLPEEFAPQLPPAYDDLATWTGCVVRDPVAGGWVMFTTGVTGTAADFRQRIGRSTSPDLRTWRRSPVALLAPDPRWYVDDHWRDPWVVRDDDGCWHMYVTAGVAGPGAGVVGHAVSDDLNSWQVRPPLSEPSGIFDQLEVISVVRLEGRWVLLFSCLSAQMPGAGAGGGGVWAVPVDGPGAPVDVTLAHRVTSEDLYVGKLVPSGSGEHRFLAFENRGPDGTFRGGVIDPCHVGWDRTGERVVLHDVPERWRPEVSKRLRQPVQPLG